MAFGKTQTTVAGLAPGQRLANAMSELDRANGAGRLDAQQVHALRSVAFSNLLIVSQLEGVYQRLGELRDALRPQ